MRRVVVTGMGIACPLGLGVEHVWQRLINSESGIGAIQAFDTKDVPCKVAGQVPAGVKAEYGLDIAEWIPVKDVKKMDRFIHLGLVAATEAVEDSGWTPEDEEDRCATGVMIGSGIGGLQTIFEASILVHEGRARRLSPFFIPSALINLASGHVSIKYGFKGPNHSAVTACATGVHAIGDAARLIMWGDADVMVAGGAEAAVCELGIAGFCASRALSTGFNDQPARASRPWDKDRDGFVMGEGAGVLVLEEYEHAKRRGAKIYAEVAGYGMSGDAYHITAPAEGHDGRGALDACGAAQRADHAGPDPVRECPRHLDAARRRPGAGGGGAGVRRRRRGPGDVIHQVGDRAPARRGRRGRGDILHPRDPRRRRAADAEPGRTEPGERDRPGRQHRAGTQDRLRIVEQLRLRRHQCIGDLPGSELKVTRRRFDEADGITAM